MDKINYNFHKSDFDKWGVKLGVFGAKESIFVLKIINLWMYCAVLYCKVQKIKVFTKLSDTGILYVVSMSFWAKKLICELRFMFMLMYCTVQYNFVPLSTVKYSFHKNVK